MITGHEPQLICDMCKEPFLGNGRSELCLTCRSKRIERNRYESQKRKRERKKSGGVHV